MPKNFADFIEHKFLEWQVITGKRQSVAAFAEWLGFSQPLVTQWINGTTKQPSPASAYKLASKLGIEVFDVLGIPRPDVDPLLLRLQTQWEILSDDERELIQNLLDQAAARQSAPGPATP